MQVVPPSSPASRFVGKESFPELYEKLNDDFSSKLKVCFTKEEEEEEKNNRDKNNLEMASWHRDNEDDDDDREGEDEEFSFTSVNADNSSITADEAFEDGQIRPVYPLFNRNLLFEPDERSLRSPLKKLFVESATTESDEESEPIGPYCSWSPRTSVEEDSPDTCRKSNSTGFSKLWRFRDLVSRSNSDGKDAFVFLNHGDKKNRSTSSGGVKRTEKGKEKKMKTRSAHERLYMRNRAIREEEKRRSYLPYKHVGFFTNVNGLTRNVHPY